MKCVYEAEPVSFECLLSAVSKARADGLSIEVGRMVLKQLDSALSAVPTFNSTDNVTADESLTETLDRVEELCQPATQSANITISLLIPLLLKLLKHL